MKQKKARTNGKSGKAKAQTVEPTAPAEDFWTRRRRLLEARWPGASWPRLTPCPVSRDRTGKTAWVHTEPAAQAFEDLTDRPRLPRDERFKIASDIVEHIVRVMALGTDADHAVLREWHAALRDVPDQRCEVVRAVKRALGKFGQHPDAAENLRAWLESADKCSEEAHALLSGRWPVTNKPYSEWPAGEVLDVLILCEDLRAIDSQFADLNPASVHGQLKKATNGHASTGRGQVTPLAVAGALAVDVGAFDEGKREGETLAKANARATANFRKAVDSRAKRRVNRQA